MGSRVSGGMTIKFPCRCCLHSPWQPGRRSCLPLHRGRAQMGGCKWAVPSSSSSSVDTLSLRMCLFRSLLVLFSTPLLLLHSPPPFRPSSPLSFSLSLSPSTPFFHHGNLQSLIQRRKVLPMHPHLRLHSSPECPWSLLPPPRAKKKEKRAPTFQN